MQMWPTTEFNGLLWRTLFNLTATGDGFDELCQAPVDFNRRHIAGALLLAFGIYPFDVGLPYGSGPTALLVPAVVMQGVMPLRLLT